MDDERFVIEVERRPALYDCNHKYYKNNVQRKRLWREIAAALGLPVEFCQEKWKRLRERFSRNIKTKAPSGSAASGSAQKEYPLVQTMRFLLPFVADAERSCAIHIMAFRVERWEQSQTEVLISELKNYPCLYVGIDNNSYNREDRIKAYSDLAEYISKTREIKVNWETIQKKVKSLRDQYTKEVARMKTDQGYKPKLWCFKQLYFFDKLKKYTESNTASLTNFERRKCRKRRATSKSVNSTAIRQSSNRNATSNFVKIAAKIPLKPVQDKFDTERLISEVHRRPVLWQRTHKLYRNKPVTDQLWEDVGKRLSCTGSVAKHKWSITKETYRQVLEKDLLQKSEFGKRSHDVKWLFVDRMAFVKDYVRPSTPDITLEETEEIYLDEGGHDIFDENSNEEVIQEHSNDLLHEEYIISSPLPASTSNSTSRVTSLNIVSHNEKSLHSNKRKSKGVQDVSDDSLSGLAQRRNVQDDNNDSLFDLAQKYMALLKEEINRDNAPESSDMTFFRSLLPFMESFSVTEKLEVRGEIQQLVLNKLKSKHN